MSFNDWLPLLVLSTSLFAAFIIFGLREWQHRWREAINLFAAVAKIVLVAYMGWGVAEGIEYETRFQLTPELAFVLRADSLTIAFAGLSSLLWLCTTIYAIGYLEDSPNRSRFFGFFSFCVASTLGVALAGNLFTFLVFYEILTLSTYPLVVHRGTEKALRAGRTYVAYALAGGAVLLIAVAWLHHLVGDLDFIAGGQLVNSAVADDGALIAIFALLIVGLGVKAALVPLHSWLPQAMVAPAPVSALLHAVAVVKAGVFGMVRVVYDLYGVHFASDLGVLEPLAWVAAATIIYGSVQALLQSDLKRRLAYSTVSQVSYVTLGITLFGPLGTIGGVVHLIHQGLMKITLFFCAGNYAETLGVHGVRALDGAGRRMPWTSMAFTVAAFGMIGAPPLAGFISKWYLGQAAVAADMHFMVWVLVVSTVLNAAYFLPIVYRLWFRSQPADWPHERIWGRHETSLWLLLPTLATAFFVIVAGVFAGVAFSPLSWSIFMAEDVYGL